jgi:hypothetical protein
MHSLPMRHALRCHAKSKRSGKRCGSPAVRGHSVCRMHGAGGGAPKGNKNALKHGDFTAESLAVKKQVHALARMARETLVAIEIGRLLPPGSSKCLCLLRDRRAKSSDLPINQCQLGGNEPRIWGWPKAPFGVCEHLQSERTDLRNLYQCVVGSHERSRLK